MRIIFMRKWRVMEGILDVHDASLCQIVGNKH